MYAMNIRTINWLDEGHERRVGGHEGEGAEHRLHKNGSISVIASSTCTTPHKQKFTHKWHGWGRIDVNEKDIYILCA